MSTTMQSYTKIEHEIIHLYREQLNLAESISDVHKVFSRTVLDLLLKVYGETVKMQVEDIALTPGTAPGYTLTDRLMQDATFTTIWTASDLHAIVERLAFNADHRFKYLKTHHENTGSKIGRH